MSAGLGGPGAASLGSEGAVTVLVDITAVENCFRECVSLLPATGIDGATLAFLGVLGIWAVLGGTLVVRLGRQSERRSRPVTSHAP
jgi:hypothetical protein